MCIEFLRLLEIKPTASYQTGHIHVYIWPTLFGRTIINLGNYNLKHDEVWLLKKMLELLDEVKVTSPQQSVPPPFLASIEHSGPKEVQVFRLPPFLAGIEPSIFILGDEFLEGEPHLAPCPELLAADKQSGFTSVHSPELTLYPQKEPWSRERVLFIWSLRKLWWFYQPQDLYIQFSLSIFSVERNIIKSSCFLVSLTPGGGGGITVLKGFFQ